MQIGSIVTEVSYGTSKPAVEGGKYPYIRMNNITDEGQLELDDLKYISLPEEEINKCLVKKGDILFNRTNSMEHVGKTCMFNLEQDMIIAGYILRIRLDINQIAPLFFSIYMNTGYMKSVLRKIAIGSVHQANINPKELQKVIIMLPPIELQNEFADYVKSIDKLKFDANNVYESIR